MYSENNKGIVIPSYTMTGTNGGPTIKLEGWAPILDRDKYIGGYREMNRSVFTCPSTFNVAPFDPPANSTTPAGSRRRVCWHRDGPFPTPRAS